MGWLYLQAHDVIVVLQPSRLIRPQVLDHFAMHANSHPMVSLAYLSRAA